LASPSRLFAGVVLVVSALAIAGLVAVDRVLRASERSRAQLAAAESAALIEGFFAARAASLGTFEGLAIVRDGVIDAPSFTQFIEAMGDRLAGFSHVWLTDSSGVVMHARQIAPAGPSLGVGIDLDTVRLLGIGEATRRARVGNVTAVGRRTGATRRGEAAMSIVYPMVVARRFAGFAVGSVTASELLANVEPPRAGNRAAVVVLAQADTIAASAGGVPTRGVPTARADVRVPGGAVWRVLVRQSATPGWARRALWAAGAVGLLALLLGFIHERRQAQRIRDRSRELEQLSSELMRANRSKSEFLANVSHELRTPLNAIVGFTELLRDGVYGELGPRQAGPVQRIEASAAHLRLLVDQVLDLAKMASGRLEMHTEILDLRPFVVEVASEIESLVAEKNLALSVAIGASVPRVRTDPIHLRQIIVNLLANAVKYTESGSITIRGRLVAPSTRTGRVVEPPKPAPIPALKGGPRPRPPAVSGDSSPDRLRLLLQAPRRDAYWVALQVADTGIGIPKQDHARIFEEFEQVNPGPRGDSMRRGTGLGLAIARRLSQLLGGDITLESEPGKGSTFTLWLPVDVADVTE
jgi:signal transduction histidine kinase